MQMSHATNWDRSKWSYRADDNKGEVSEGDCKGVTELGEWPIL